MATTAVPGASPPVMTNPDGSINWGNLLAGGGLAIADLVGAFGGGSTGAVGQSQIAAAAADPFASQRPGYQKQLFALMTDPNSFKTDPGYQFGKEQGLEAISRSSNALYGTGRTGSLAPELDKFATGYAEQAYDTRIAQLMAMAGVGAGSPGTAGALLSGGFDKQSGNIAGGVTGLANALAASGLPQAAINGIIRAIGGGSGGGVDPTTGDVTYGPGSTGTGDQGGWPGDTSGIDFTGGGGGIPSDWGGALTDPWYG